MRAGLRAGRIVEEFRVWTLAQGLPAHDVPGEASVAKRAEPRSLAAIAFREGEEAALEAFTLCAQPQLV